MDISFDLTTTALLVIDMQNDFVLPTGAIPVKGIQNGLPHYQKFLETCRVAGMRILFTRHTFTPEKNPIEGMLFPELQEGGLRAGSTGHDIVQELAPNNDETVLDKHKYNAFYETSLDSILRSAGIKTLIITGTITEVCCETTARAAMERDYKVLFVSDLTFTSDPKRHLATLDVIASHIGWVMTSDSAMMHLSSL